MNWAKLGVTPADLISDAKARHTSRQWREGFQPHPLTYLNGERWNDEMEKEKLPRTQEAVQAYLDKNPDAVPKYLHAKHWTAAHDYLSGATS